MLGAEDTVLRTKSTPVPPSWSVVLVEKPVCVSAKKGAYRGLLPSLGFRDAELQRMHMNR